MNGMKADECSTTCKKGGISKEREKISGSAGELEKGGSQRKAWQTPEGRREANRKYRERHPDRLRDRRKADVIRRNAYRRKWREKNRDKLIEKERAYRRSIREHANAYAREWSAKNPDKVKRYQRDYARRHAGKMCLKSANRRAKVKASPAELRVIAKWESGWRKKRAVRCYWCRGVFAGAACHSEHIVPLKKEGPHSISNLAISCASCNVRKHASSITDWNQKIPMPVLAL